jgi:hypothetical protein
VTGKPNLQDLIPQALRRLEKAAHDRGWEQPPQLFGFSLEASESGIRVVALEAQFPESFWQRERPADVLERLASIMERHQVRPPDVTVGFAFLSEAWMILNPSPLDLAIGAKKRTQDHRRRIEVRTVCAVDQEGTAYYLVRPRGGTPQSWASTDLRGTIPDALRRMIAVIHGVGAATPDGPQGPKAI